MGIGIVPFPPIDASPRESAGAAAAEARSFYRVHLRELLTHLASEGAPAATAASPAWPVSAADLWWTEAGAG